ncbi:hypothetical protein [Acidothermus cellulolyticus]|uniref:hypothetical protein n=1 Tax=Acidothermus cellulolyticus TaxID=28049 RepID=UPI0011D0D69C|nr:hypothetical protein [Acidothermus cellulolyticus]
MSELQALFEMWHCAESPAVVVTRVSWPELARVLQVAKAFRPHVETSTIAGKVLRGVFDARKVLTCTPLWPAHELTGIGFLIKDLEQFLVDRPGHTLWQSAASLTEALRELFATQSPVASALGELLSEYGAALDGTPEAVLAVPRPEWMDPIQDWLAAEEFDCVDVAIASDLRTRSDIRRVCIILGHPAIAFASPFRGQDVILREYGWLLTAPAATKVRVVLTVDAPTLPADDIWLLPSEAHPQLSVCDDGPAQPIESSRDWACAVETPSSVRRISRLQAPSSVGETMAVEIQLRSGHAIFFHNELGPRPYVVSVDDEAGAVILLPCPVQAIERGDVLAVRCATAPHMQIVVRANEWLSRSGWTLKKIERVSGYPDQIRKALRRALDREGHDTLWRQLTDILGDGEYARTLLRSPLDESYIAPRRSTAFEALTKVIGVEHLAAHFDDLVRIRIARQQAGEEIRRDLLECLKDRRWASDVDRNGWAVLDVSDLGTLLLAMVTARIEEPVPVPLSCLGALFDDHGCRVTTLSRKVGA